MHRKARNGLFDMGIAPLSFEPLPAPPQRQRLGAALVLFGVSKMIIADRQRLFGVVGGDGNVRMP